MKKANRNQTGTIFNIQKFSVNDGPGIRTVVFMKGCPLRCPWCANPESQSSKKQILWDAKKCIHCRHCIETCPKQAINDQNQIDHSICDGCEICVKECPAHALEAEGRIQSVQEVLDIVLQDQVFYEEDNGGMTLSGGEFFTQPIFSKELLKAAKEEGLHTCCETTGYVKEEIFQDVIPYIDYILFDMKHWDTKKHKEYTKVSNELPLKNMGYAKQMNKTILPRIPVIPGFNDSLEDALQFSNKLKELNFDTCQLLPFHQFGENKYHLLNQKYAYEDVPSYHKEDLEDYKNTFIENGIKAYF